jgi:hypothetical protein
MRSRTEVFRRVARPAVATATVAALLALAGCGGGGDGESGTQAAHQPGVRGSSGGISGAEQRQARKRLGKDLGVSPSKLRKLRSGRGLGATKIRPAEIVPGGPGPFFSSDTIYPLANGWEAGDRRTYTAVDAGGNPARPSVGELGIFRQDFVKVTQTQHVVNVPGAGTLRIVKAPLGPAAATSAQASGDLEFVGSRGVRGVLHLSDDSVTITRR